MPGMIDDRPDFPVYIGRLVLPCRRQSQSRRSRSRAFEAWGPRLKEQHLRTEEELKASGLPYTILRPDFFMQNTIMTAQMKSAVYVPTNIIWPVEYRHLRRWVSSDLSPFNSYSKR